MLRFVLTLTLVLASSLSAFADKLQRPNGLTGVPFGSAPADVVRILVERSGLTPPESLPTTFDVLELTGGNFAGQEVQKWTLEFVNQKFASAIIHLKIDGRALTTFTEIKSHLVAKYGPPTGERKLTPPNNLKKNQPSNDPNPSLTYGRLVYWKFTPTLTEKNLRYIACQASDSTGHSTNDPSKLQLSLEYTDQTLLPPSKSAAKAESKSSAPIKKEDL
ncbi:MAG: hypothetical protein WCI46_13315 [Verrucomicrobiota bacterium]